MVSDDAIRAAVTAAAARRGEALSADELATLVQLLRGQLRLAMSDLPVDQVAQKLTDVLLDGRRDVPPDLHRPQLRQLVASAHTTLGLPPPAGGVSNALVNVAVGWMNDASLEMVPGGRPVVMHNVVGLYLAGM